MSYINGLLTNIYRAEQKEKTLAEYYIEVNKAVEEMKLIFPITADVEKMRQQQEHVIVQCFLSGLGQEYDVIRTQMLTGTDLPNLSDMYARLRRVCKDNVTTCATEPNDPAAFVGFGGRGT
ncbi:hypothetical protein ACFE04_019693 [Oxalis oulophora]